MKTTIRIQNFKSLEDVTLELAPTTVFLGPNGAGKSSVLKCLEFVSNNIQKVTPSSPQKTNYKLQNNVNLGLYRNIVTNNDPRKDVVVELFHEDAEIDSYINEVGVFWVGSLPIKNVFREEELSDRNMSQSWLDVDLLFDFSDSEKETLINLFLNQKNFFEYTKKNYSTLKGTSKNLLNF